MEVLTYPESWLELAETGQPKPYLKTFNFPGAYINDRHAAFVAAPGGRMGLQTCIDLGVDGYLLHTDALKLYELAYCAQGNILELGTYKGLSASIIAKGISDSGRRNCSLTTCEINRSFVRIAKRNLSRMDECRISRVGVGPLARGLITGFRNIIGRETIAAASCKRVDVYFRVGDATELMDVLIANGLKYGFIFVDHWHGYDATYQAAIRIAPLLEDGGFVMFHDFNDGVSKLPDHVHKVYQAVGDTIVKDPQFRFCMIVGGAAIFQKSK
jgi:predicted O-methyltransferase YrrM